MKNFKKLMIGSLAIASLTQLQANQYQLSVGIANVNLDGKSNSGTTIELKQGEDKGFGYNIGYIITKDYGVGSIGVQYNFKLSNKIYMGPNIDVVGVNTKNDTSQTTSFQGFAYGLNVRYKLAQKHCIDISYKKGSVTSNSGIITLDLSTTKLAYSYRF